MISRVFESGSSLTTDPSHQTFLSERLVERLVVKRSAITASDITARAALVLASFVKLAPMLPTTV